MACSAPISNRSPSFFICSLHWSRRAAMRAFSSSLYSPRFMPGRGKGTGKQSAASSHPRSRAWERRSSPSIVASRLGP